MPLISPNRPLLLASLTLLGAVLSGCQQGVAAPAAPAAASAPAVIVGVQVLQADRVELATELPGRVSAALVAEVRPQVRGIVRSRHYSEGAQVRAGQVLYQIEPDSYRIALASAQATVARAQATLEAARLTAERRTELLKIDGISRQDQQDAQTALKQAEAELAGAVAARDAAQLNLERTTVTAPISGRVDVSTVTPGALVTADQSTALTTVRQLDPIQIDISQSSAELLRLKRELASGRLQRIGSDAARVRLLLEDGSSYALPARLSFAGVAVNSATGAVTLRAQVANPDGVLLPGMYVRAVLETAVIEQGLLVPQQALQRDSRGQASVLLVDAQNKVQRRNVVTSRAYRSGWLVSSGLEPGERVIVEGLQKVRAGDEVRSHEIASAAASHVVASAASR
jgi:membrane fusion protein (multidrug efflux system)